MTTLISRCIYLSVSKSNQSAAGLKLWSLLPMGATFIGGGRRGWGGVGWEGGWGGAGSLAPLPWKNQEGGEGREESEREREMTLCNTFQCTHILRTSSVSWTVRAERDGQRNAQNLVTSQQFLFTSTHTDRLVMTHKKPFCSVWPNLFYTAKCLVRVTAFPTLQKHNHGDIFMQWCIIIIIILLLLLLLLLLLMIMIMSVGIQIRWPQCPLAAEGDGQCFCPPESILVHTCLYLTPLRVYGTHPNYCASVKDPISICRDRAGASAGGTVWKHENYTQGEKEKNLCRTMTARFPQGISPVFCIWDKKVNLISNLISLKVKARLAVYQYGIKRRRAVPKRTRVTK